MKKVRSKKNTGVQLAISLAFTSAPNYMNFFIISNIPCCAATIKGVL